MDKNNKCKNIPEKIEHETLAQARQRITAEVEKFMSQGTGFVLIAQRHGVPEGEPLSLDLGAGSIDQHFIRKLVQTVSQSLKNIEEAMIKGAECADCDECPNKQRLQ